MIIDVILSLILACLFVFVGTAVYAFVLLKRRPPMKLYEQRKSQQDFAPLDQIPSRLIELLISQEDPKFYSHHGYDAGNILDAWKKNFKKKQLIYGASTITQQLAKNLYLRFNRNILRKIVEILIALYLERSMGKDRILEMYVNIIYFGNGNYGIFSAAQFYFHKSVADLSLNQMLMLTIILPAPTAANPIQFPEMFLRIRSKYLNYFTNTTPPQISREEAENILSHDASCLDPELRKQDDFTRNYPQTIPLINERFGPFPINEKKDSQ